MAASYGTGRVNVSQYLRNLNVQGPSVEETLTDEDLEKDLALFTNTQFFDFETGQHTDYQAPPPKPEVAQSSSPSEDVTPTDSIMGDFPAGYEFPIASDFSFGDYNSNFTSPTVPAFPDALGNLQPIQPSPQTAYPPSQHHQHQPTGYVPPAPPPLPAGPPTGVGAGGFGVGRNAAEERKAETIRRHAHAPNGRVLNFEDASRMAAEEDKRKRNTAASARFRIKKKQREQALEKNSKEMMDKVTMLEGRISALETENKWLKSLVTEKHGGKDDILEKLLKEVTSQEGGVRDSIKAASAADKASRKKD
ncbi:hypothetical protein C8A00DRAFT_13888 [Chaetomidium leptoderma]|uniref:BZIP domain-containing protein n=1 Tax=Chaetomidium leptoderma TaxID=669021 RepID=A0AAN6VQK6_9PEZI|nr:hypothetical protein C8A00DRAFT_13888 [Chaetomidium leptoderma]